MSDLPNTESYSVITNAIAWDLAKKAAGSWTYDTKEEYFDTLLKFFHDAREVVVDQKDPKDIKK